MKIDKRVTIVCCYNVKKQYEEFVSSLNNQRECFDLIGIDNSENRYRSCSEAYNSVLKDVKTRHLIFSHQDIILDRSNMLEDFVNYLEKVGTFDIVGVAGAKAGEKRIFTNVHNGEGKCAGEASIVGIQKFDTVDECFFGGTTECFKKYPFDEVLCDNWHLYAVERCLNAIANGNSVYACDIPLIHKSRGRINHAFNINLYKICKVYSNKFKRIRTTCANTKTDFIGRTLFYLKREIRVWFEKYFVYRE